MDALWAKLRIWAPPLCQKRLAKLRSIPDANFPLHRLYCYYTVGDEKDAAPGTKNSPVERVQRILQQLPERYKEVLTYRFLLKLTVSEAAQIMGVTETNVKTLQFRALNRAVTLESAMTDGD